MAVRVGINGFGRIGRNVLRAALVTKQTAVEFTAVNDITDPKTLAHLLKYDSIHGRFPAKVQIGEDALIVDGKTIRVNALQEPQKLPWRGRGRQLGLGRDGRLHDRG